MTNALDVAAANFSMADAQSAIIPLIIMILGITAYSVLIFKFYKFFGRKDIFGLDMGKYNQSTAGILHKAFDALLYVFKYIIIFPILIFFWFAIISIILIILSNKLDVSQIMLVSMGLVASIRVAAYYNEDLSNDLAKLLPLTLLAIFLLDMSLFSYNTFISQLNGIPGLWKQMAYYLAFTILLEIVLRASHRILKRFSGNAAV